MLGGVVGIVEYGTERGVGEKIVCIEVFFFFEVDLP